MSNAAFEGKIRKLRFKRLPLVIQVSTVCMQWDLMGAAQKWPYIRRDLRHVDHISDHHCIVATLFPEIS